MATIAIAMINGVIGTRRSSSVVTAAALVPFEADALEVVESPPAEGRDEVRDEVWSITTALCRVATRPGVGHGSAGSAPLCLPAEAILHTPRVRRDTGPIYYSADNPDSVLAADLLREYIDGTVGD